MFFSISSLGFWNFLFIYNPIFLLELSIYFLSFNYSFGGKSGEEVKYGVLMTYCQCFVSEEQSFLYNCRLPGSLQPPYFS